MSTGGQDLFVVCKSCGSEVSPYITECPYCGNRLRKRAPKLDRDQKPSQGKARRTPSPLLSRLRHDEIPGIRPDRRPIATAAIVVASLIGCLLWRTGLGGVGSELVLAGKPGSEWWRVVTASFVYDNTGYAFITLGAIGLFGWLLERRHGRWLPIALFCLGGIGGTAAAAAVLPHPLVLGAQGGGLALLCAWAVPDLITLRARGEVEGDLLGAAAIGAALALMPLAVADASWVGDVVGIVVGVAAGVPLSRAVLR